MLIDRGCDVNAGAGEYELTPLHKAAANGFSEIARLLISEGASVTRLSRYMYTDHMQGPNQESIQALLDAGCDVTSLTAKGNRGIPLHYALTVATIALLVDEGADVNGPDALGDTPLHKAFSRNLHEGGELLISKGARVNAVNAKGQSPLHVAAEKGQLGTIRLLREHGADTNLRDEKGRTPHEVFVQSARIPWLDIYQTMGMRHLSASEKQDAKDLLAPAKKQCVIC